MLMSLVLRAVLTGRGIDEDSTLVHESLLESGLFLERTVVV